MTKMMRKVLSAILALSLSLSLCAPAFAANGRVNVEYADGSTATLVNTSDIILHEVGKTEVSYVTVSDGVTQDTYEDFSTSIEKTLTGGTRYQLVMETSRNGGQTLHFKYLNELNDDIDVAVAAKAATYSVNVNSGAFGQNNNYGGSATCHQSTDSTQLVDGGGSYEVTFTPMNGQEITKLNLRTNATDALGIIADAKTGAASVGTQAFKITVAANGAVIVRVNSVTQDLYITALTKDESEKVGLDIITDRNCTANASGEMVPVGTKKTVTFTANNGFMVTDITITDGSSTGTLKLNDESIRVNGKLYSVKRKLDGSAVLSIPAMDSDVCVSAIAASDVHYIKVVDTKDARANKAGVNYVQDGDSFTFIYTPSDNSVELRSLTVSSPSLGTMTYSLTDGIRDSYGNYWFSTSGKWFNGTSWDNYLNSDIRVFFDSRDRLNVEVLNIHENVEFSISAHNTALDVNVKGDNGVDFEKSHYDVDEGDNMDVVFTPSKSSYQIKYLHINYGGRTYKVNVDKDSYVQVSGQRWKVEVSTDGVVTLKMLDICEDVTIRAESNYISRKHMSISKNAGSHTSITYTGNNSFDSDDSPVIRVYADRNYVLSSVTFKANGRTSTIKPFDRELKIDGYTYPVNWVDNTECNIEFAPLPGNLTVTSKAVKGSVENNPSYPTQPSYPVQPPVSASYHPMYMNGFGDGTFRPNETLTRAQAVVMLTRAVLQVDDNSAASYKGNTAFVDVTPNFWAAGSINYAAALGYLDILSLNGVFRPNAPISRAEYLALLCRFRGIDVSGTTTQSKYSDVPSTHWAAKYINYATDKGWVVGYGNGTFGPDSAVTRAAMCTMTNHVLGRTTDPMVTSTTGATFNDVPITFWAYADIFEASHAHYATTANGYETWIR